MKIYLKILIFLLVAIFLFFLVGSLAWSHEPCILLNTKINTVSKTKIEDIEESSLFICNHDIATFDQMAACSESGKSKRKINIVSWKKENSFFQNFIKELPMFPKYNLIYTGNGLTKVAVDKLKSENVWFFLRKNWNNKGIYYILKEKRVPIVITRISYDDNIDKDSGIIKKNFNRKIKIEYNKIDNYELGNDPDVFMNYIKKKLF